jgi:hypothetical protein
LYDRAPNGVISQNLPVIDRTGDARRLMAWKEKRAYGHLQEPAPACTTGGIREAALLPKAASRCHLIATLVGAAPSIRRKITTKNNIENKGNATFKAIINCAKRFLSMTPCALPASDFDS